MKTTLILTLLALSTTGCVSFISDDTVYEKGAFQIKVIAYPALTTMTAGTGNLPPLTLIGGDGFGSFTNQNGGSSRSSAEAAAQIRAAVVGKGSATAEGESGATTTGGE